MKIEMSGIGRVSLIFAAAIGYGLAQQTVPERHVRDIEKDQPRTVITASPLCLRTMANPQATNQHKYPVDRSTLAPDLKSLMETSDDVILTSGLANGAEVIAPSGDDVIHYEDVKVMRTWKGSHKAGDTVTFAIPEASVHCSPVPVEGGGPRFSTYTGLGYWAWSGAYYTYVLFLRHAQGSETQLTPGLRMTGGSGMQGIYPVQFPIFSPLIKESHCQNDFSANKYPDDPKLCTEFLDTSDLPILVPLTIDPLFKKYNGMQVSEFLDEVQKEADALGYAPPSDSVK